WRGGSPVCWRGQQPCTLLAISTGMARSRKKVLQQCELRHGRTESEAEVNHAMHVAIIMDGNGRWAARRGLPRVAGHRAGVATVRRIVEHAPKVGINCLTLYAFSTDNWRRPSSEVQSIFWLMRAYLRLETERLREAGVRMGMIGRRDRVPKLLLQEMEKTEFATTEGSCLYLRIAVDYSSREAISRAAVDASRELSERTAHPRDVLRDMLA